MNLKEVDRRHGESFLYYNDEFSLCIAIVFYVHVELPLIALYRSQGLEVCFCDLYLMLCFVMLLCNHERLFYRTQF